MKFSRGKRVTLLALLLIVLSALLIVGGIDRPPAPELGDYPEAEEIAQQPETYQNQQVSLVGQVVSTDPITVRGKLPCPTSLTHRGVRSLRAGL